MVDYYSMLLRAVTAPGAGDAQWRRDIYDRARRMLASRLRTLRPPPPPAEIAAEESALKRRSSASRRNCRGPSMAQSRPTLERMIDLATSAANPGARASKG